MHEISVQFITWVAIKRCSSFNPSIPLQVVGEAKGRLYTTEELERKFSRALSSRITNRYDCVTLHSYHFYVEEGLPRTQVLLWVDGHELRAMFENVGLPSIPAAMMFEMAQSKTSGMDVIIPTPTLPLSKAHWQRGHLGGPRQTEYPALG
jgi:hypothetical protein